MAANFVEILVKARDEAKPDLDDLRAKLEELAHTVADARVTVTDADAAAKLDRMQAKLADLQRKANLELQLSGALRVEAELHAVEATLDRLNSKAKDIGGPSGPGGIQGLLGKLFFGDNMGTSGPGTIGGLLSGGGELPKLLSSFGAGAAVAAPAIAALATELVGVANGFAAAGAGGAAFFALTKPAVSALTANFSQFHQAVLDYQDASRNLNTAIGTNKSNMQAFQATIHGVSPDLAAAAKLLTDQGVQWQNLTPKMQNALIALSNNKAEMKAMLPDQKAALKALLEQGDALGNLDPQGQRAVGMLQRLTQEFNKISTAFEPTAFKIFGDGLKIVTDTLPALVPMATAFANALHPLMEQLDRFVQSKGFAQWLQQFDKLIGPATAAIGAGVGKIAIAFGQLLTVMSSKDVAHAINIIADMITGTLRVITAWIHGVMQNWDSFSSAMAKGALAVMGALHAVIAFISSWADEIRTRIERVVSFFAQLPGKIMSALARLPDLLFRAGANAIGRLADGLASGIGRVASVISGIASKVAGFFGLSPAVEGPLSGGGAPEIRGAHFAADFARGIQSGTGRVGAAAGALAGAAAAGGGAGGTLRLEVAPGGGSAFEQFMVQALRNYVRVRGGSVQSALGH